MIRKSFDLWLLVGLTILGLSSSGIAEAQIAYLDSPNQAPTLDAGPSQTIAFTNEAPLDGTVTDDGLPNGTVTTTWAKVSGPGTVIFGNPAAVDTTASFTLPGTYILSLTANDGALSTSAQATITYNEIPLVQVPDARGIWTGLLTRTLSNCRHAASNGSGNKPVIFEVQSNGGAAFTSVGAFGLDLMEGTYIVHLLLRNSVNPNGTFAGRGSFELRRINDHAFGGSGVVQLAGTISGNHLTFTHFEGPIGGENCRLTATGSLNRSGAAIPSPISVPINNPYDYSRDAKADLLWKHIYSGTVVIWQMDGSVIDDFGFPGRVPPPWQIMGIGDVNGDGQADVVWQDQDSHIVAIWMMEGFFPLSVGFPGAVSSEWKLIAVGDTNGDRKTDLIWVNEKTGQIGIWLMNGHVMSTSGVLSPVAGEWVNWQVKGVGDVDANGKEDIVWHNLLTGEVAIWLMDGTTIVSMGFPGRAPTDWEIAGLGDLDGRGTTDIVWRNIGSGAVAVWFMNGNTIGSVETLGGVPLAWRIVQAADANGDGEDDVFWQHTNGTVAVWLMNGTVIESVGFPGGVSSEWAVQPLIVDPRVCCLTPP